MAMSGWFASRGVIALSGYSVFIVPWMGSKANTNWATRTQDSTYLGGGYLITDTTAQNNSVTYDVWLDAGTYKLALLHFKWSNQGIYNITGINGTQTIDGYAAGASGNNYSEVTGITVTAGLKTVVLTMATKNGSSSAYGGTIQSIAFIRTGA